MAQTGYTPILIYSSSTTTNAPAAGNLTNSTLGSELAINITDGKLFYKDNANAVQVIAWKTTPTSAGGTGLTSYTAGDMLYYATGTALSKLTIGASTTIMTSSGSAPQWSAASGITVGTATNIAGGAAGSVPYQTGAGATSLLGIGTAYYMLGVNAGATAPSWQPSATSVLTAQGDLLYASAANTLARLAKDASATRYLSNTGTTNNPAWAQINLANGVTGTLPTSNGGTGQVSNLTQYGVVYGSTTTAMATTLAGTSTQVLHGNASGAPTWSSVSLTADVSGTLPTARGGTNLTSFNNSGIVYASSTSALATTSAFTWDGNLGLNLAGSAAGVLDVEVAVGAEGVVYGIFRNNNGTQVNSLVVNSVATSSYNTAVAALWVGRASANGRGLNAGGTVNASGADYAEYMTKAGDFSIAKGDVCGINAQGKLTNIFNDAVSFVVKSTDPSYVGGDTWGNEESLGLLFPEKTSQRQKTENAEAETDEEFAIRQAIYQSDKAAFDIALEAARQRVDRIAFAGQVPVNVLGATAGQYIIPVNNNGAIKGNAVSNPTFEQYQIAVGKVIAIESDGRAKIIVKVT